MTHFINFGLLFCFLTLIVTGILSFVLPFDIVVARVHIIFGLTTVMLVCLHLYTKFRYFKKQSRVQSKVIAACFVVCSTLLLASVENWWPVRKTIETGYESRHQSEIVRPHPLIASVTDERQHSTARAVESGETALSIHLVLTPPEQKTAVAIWSESKNGTIIETLYLSPELAYSDKPLWNGKTTPRHHIIPIWRHRYTAINSMTPDGKIDVVSGATSKHTFSLDKHLKSDGEPFSIFVEVNIPNDPNRAYPDPHIGQPSTLYSAYIDPKEAQKYYLAELTGHGGDGRIDGGIYYNTEQLTSSKEIIDLILIRFKPYEKSKQPHKDN